MRIVFIDPKGVWEGLNNGIAYIATNLSKSGHSVNVVDFVNRQGNEDKRLEIAKDADYVGISIKSFTLDESVRLADKIKKLNPKAVIIAGGPHIMVDGMNFMKENPIFDVGIKGEAELAFKELMEKPPNEVDGALYREGGEVRENCARKWISELDELEFPDYDSFDSVNYNGEIHKIDKWPLVTSRGCPYVCSYCFPSGTLVHTEKGMVEIEKLKESRGIRVLSHSGKWMPVIRSYERSYSGKLVKIKARKLPTIKATLNHKFHVLRNGIKMELGAEEIQKGDYMAVQIPYTEHTEYIDVKQVIGNHELIYEYSRKIPFEKIKVAVQLHKEGFSTRQIASKTGLSKSFVHTAMNNVFEEKKRVKNSFNEKEGIAKFTLSKGIPSKIPITKDLSRLFGYYLAEGSVTKSKRRPNSYTISWTFRNDEIAYIEDVKYLIKNIFDLDPLIVNQNSVTRVYVSNAPISMLFEKLFGSGSGKKSIPEIIMKSDAVTLEGLLKGWILGDGGIVRYEGKKMIKASTVSHSLAYQFFIIAQKIGFSPSLQKNNAGSSEINGRKIDSCGYNYHLSFKSKRDVKRLSESIFGIEIAEDAGRTEIEIRDENAVYFPVESADTEDFTGIVYNIEVEEDHTYTANGFLVNNCNVPTVIGRKFRTRSGENIMNELRYAQEKYGCTEFKVLDDNFTLLMDRAKDICRFFIDEGLDMKWTCPNGIRADRLDDELCELMVKAGCYSVSIGVESGDPEVFRKINKGEKLEDVEHGIAIAKKAGLKVHGFFILGLVGSTYETDKRSMEFVKKVGLESASWGILVPYPGTEVWNQVRADPNVRMLRDWKEGFHIGARPKPVFDTPEYPADERVKAFYLANLKFTKKRDYPRAAKMVIKSLLAGK